MLTLCISLALTAGVIGGYLLGVSVGEYRATTQWLDAQARRLELPPYLTSDERWQA